MYISITGLKPKGPLQVPRFWWHAIRSMRQAQRAAGNISVEARTIDGTHHTLTLWVDRAAMRAYLSQGAHRGAMRASRSIGTGTVFGYEDDTAPAWSEVPALLRDRGRVI
jgi:heme-degrading monooxygenase HmoA